MAEGSGEFLPPVVIRDEAQQFIDLKNATPAPTVEMWDFIPKEIPLKAQHTAMICYGQGPVIDTETKTKAERAAQDGQEVQEEINTWGRTIAVAAGYLIKKGLLNGDAFFSGGQTGGSAYQAESELMATGMEQVWGQKIIPEERMHRKDTATNTLENLALTLNTLDKNRTNNDSLGKEKLLLLCAGFHTSRTKIMAGLFGLQNVTIMSAEEVLKLMAHDSSVTQEALTNAVRYLMPERNPHTNQRQSILNWVDERTDPSRLGLDRVTQTDTPADRLARIEPASYVGGGTRISQRYEGYTQFEKTQGEEAKDPIKTRLHNESKFTEGLATIPENWIGYLSKIENNDRLTHIVRNLRSWRPSILEEFGIDQSDNPDTIRIKLAPYIKEKRKYVSTKDRTPWRKETFTTVDGLLDFFATLKQSS